MVLSLRSTRKQASLIKKNDKKETISNSLKLITENNFSQIQVTSDGRIVGSIFENLVFNKILENPEAKNEDVERIMQPALPYVDITTPVDDLSRMISDG